MKNCELFSCKNTGVQMYQIAPGTNVWLCTNCTKTMKQDDEVNSVKSVK